MSRLFVVRWCGGLVRAPYHATRESAEDWIKAMYESAADAKQSVYGSYTITEEDDSTRKRRAAK